MIGRQREERVCSLSPVKFRLLFKKLLSSFNLDGNYNVYSLRRGGATAYFFKTGSLDQTLTIGRWECASTARIYIQQGAAEASELKLEKLQRIQLQKAAKLL